MESDTKVSTQHEPETEGLSVVYDPVNPTVDVVFVHGFPGNPKETWTCETEVNKNDSKFPSKFPRLFEVPSLNIGSRGLRRKSVCWPSELLPTTIPTARILTFGYDIHVGHRFGRSSTSFRTVYESTSGIIFFGTPFLGHHSGADPRGLFFHIAQTLVKVAGYTVNDRIVNTLLPSSERLKELREHFGPMAHEVKWTIYSFQEQYKLKALGETKVVDDMSSCIGDPRVEVVQHLARNHMNMCRFSGQNDLQYQKVVATLHRIREVTPKPNPAATTPPPQPATSKYLKSLEFEQIEARHATIKNAHYETCKWLLGKSEYQDWRDINKLAKHRGLMWIKGKPGTGKSTLMKFAYASVKNTMKDATAISFFFNARGNILERSTEGMFRSLLLQLLEAHPELHSVFDTLALAARVKVDTQHWDIKVLKTLFYEVIKHLRQKNVTCFIDALDECAEDQTRGMLRSFEHLMEFTTSSGIKFHVLFSSRHYPHISIEKGIELILEGQEGHEQDIAKYLHRELRLGKDELAKEINEEITKRASGIFLWVVLAVGILNKEFDRGRMHGLRKRLNEIPDALDEYATTDRYFGTSGDDQAGTERVPFLKYAKCNVLYHAELAEGYGISQVSFLGHFCLQDWVQVRNSLERYRVRHYTSGVSLLYVLAEQNLPHLIRLELDSEKRLGIPDKRYMFPLNATLTHKNESAIRVFLGLDITPHSDGILSGISSLSVTNNECQGVVELLLAEGRLITSSVLPRHLFSWAAQYGIVALVKVLLATNKILVDVEDASGRTPLGWAAENSNPTIVKLLLDTGKADPDTKDFHGEITFSKSLSRIGHTATAKLLLDADKVDPNPNDSHGRTPLQRAGEKGDVIVVKPLPDTGKVDADSKYSELENDTTSMGNIEQT
ncbi:hypothetical protein AJ80_06117 [Polytolypa hystricis UAMH7299]|uniref:Nephrocystin 3-like N-terminal domain-containing protein n=1 Tax=Polytolypa hystricis (strain UAMH7299) TaxID=1447883 RepID=A0A2B7XZS6_POLH7|nr:hypothetical protein AJ80_06117 [Polytolypa hystricis UAMH7299]